MDITDADTVCSLLFLTLFDYKLFLESLVTKKNPFTDKDSDFHMDESELADFSLAVLKQSGADKFKRKVGVALVVGDQF